MKTALGDFLYKCSLGIGGIFYAILLVAACVYMQTGIHVEHPVFSVLEIVFLLALAVMCCQMLGRLPDRYLRVICPMAVAVILCGQVLFVFLMRVQIRADALQIYREAIELVCSGAIEQSSYLSIYPNNIPATILTGLLLRGAALLHLPMSCWMRYLQICNAIGISLGIFYGYRLLAIIGGWKKAGLFCLLCLFHPLIYAYAAWYYTGTLSIPFLMAGLYYSCKFYLEKKYRYIGAAAVLFFFGSKIRITTGIAVIALVICGIVAFLKGKLKEPGKMFRGLLVSAAAAAVAAVIFGAVQTGFVRLDYEDSAYPVTHWLMMASHGDGGYDAEDCRYTESFLTKEEKKEAVRERWMEYLKQSDWKEKARLVLRKMSVTWAVGDDRIQDNLEWCERYGTLYGYISGNNREILALILQAVRILNLLCLGTGILILWKRKEIGLSYAGHLTVMGGIVFYMLWEASAEYSIPFLFLILML